MDKKEFLKKLSGALSKLQTKEKDKYISFYDEIISDLVDGGMTEQEAVAKQGKLSDISRDILSQVDSDKLAKKNVIGTVLLVLTIISVIASVVALILIPDVASFALMEADGPNSILVATYVKEPVWLYILTLVVIIITIIYFAVKKKMSGVIIGVIALLVFGITFAFAEEEAASQDAASITQGDNISTETDREQAIKDRAALVIEYVTYNDFQTLKNEYAISELQEVLNDEYMLSAKNMVSQDWGSFISNGTMYITYITQNNDDYTVVVVNSTYEKVAVTYTITLDKDLMLAGIYMR